MKTWILSILWISIAGSVAAIDYEKDIMPILAAKCSECHSETEKVKGGFKVDDPDHIQGRLTKNNLVVPGDWDASYLFVTLFRPADHKDAMPPEGKGERLTPEETALVQLWIAEGATINGQTGEKGYMPKEGEPGFVANVSQGGSSEKESSGLPEMAQPTEWTNTDGKTITATLMGVEGEFAVLKMTDGKIHRYPIEKLSAESQAALKE